MTVILEDVRKNWKKLDSEVIKDAIRCERNTYNSVRFRLPDNELQESINHIQNICNGDLYEQIFMEYYGNKFEPIGEKGIWTDEKRTTEGEPDFVYKDNGKKVEFKCYNMTVETFVEEGTKYGWFQLNNGKFHNAKHILFCSRPEGYKMYHFWYDEREKKWWYDISPLSTEHFISYMKEQVRARRLDWWHVQ